MSDTPARTLDGRDRLEQTPSDRLVPHDHSYAEPHSGYGSGIEQLLTSKQGYIVGRLGNRVLRLDTDGHILTIAPTRSGKGVSCIIPNLLDHPGSAFVIDIRGDTIARTASARLLMGQQVVVLDPYKVTGGRWGYDSFNPLDVLKPGAPGFEQNVKRIAQAILFDPEGRGSKEPIWDNATILALTGALTYIRTCLPPERQNLLELRRLFSLQPERRAAIAEEVTKASHASGRYEGALDVFVEFLTAGSEKTKIPDNTVVQLMTILDWVNHADFADLLHASTFSFETLQEAPTTVYLVLPEEYIKGCEVWVRLLFNAALFQLKEVNSIFGKTSNALRQAERVLFLLDEFPQFGKLQPVEDGMATVAGRGATLWLFVQNISQLDRLYGEHSARQIVGNSSLIQAFNSNEVHELEYFSKLVGEEMFDVQSVTIGMNTSSGGSKGTSRTVTVGNSESLTLGTSRSSTAGESRTVTDGTSSTKTRGTSDTTTEGRTRGTSDSVSDGSSVNIGESTSSSKGTNRGTGGGDGTNTSQSRGTSGDHTIFDYLGFDLPNWKTKNRGDSWGRSYNRNWSQGINESLSKSSNTGRSSTTSRSQGTSDSRTSSRSRGVSESESVGTSHSEAWGTSRSETTGDSESRTAGTSKSEAEGINAADNWSSGNNISYSVKPEQRKIETPRSLRRSMSGGSQLLALRGYYAFVAPRLLYFEKDQTTQSYRFPEMAILARETTLEELWRGLRTQSLSQAARLSSTPDNPFLMVQERMRAVDAASSTTALSVTEQQRIRESVQEVIRGISVLQESRKTLQIVSLTDAERDDALLGFYEFAMRFAAQFKLDQPNADIDSIAEKSGPVSFDAGPIRTLDNLLLTDAQEIRGLLTPPGTQDDPSVVHGAWLIKHYRAALNAAWASLLQIGDQVKGQIEGRQKAMQFIAVVVQEVERCIDGALSAAAMQNIHRRRNANRTQDTEL